MGTQLAVRVKFLDELTKTAAADVLASLACLDTTPDQRDFTLPGSAVLEKSRHEPARRTFAIFLGELHAAKFVGIGVLQPDGANRDVWPSGQPHVVLRGFSVDAGYQGQGIGTSATGEAVALATPAGLS